MTFYGVIVGVIEEVGNDPSFEKYGEIVLLGDLLQSFDFYLPVIYHGWDFGNSKLFECIAIKVWSKSFECFSTYSVSNLHHYKNDCLFSVLDL